MSAKFHRALEKLGEKGLSLDDLPTDREATDWNVIAAETSLGPLELVALKTYKVQQRSQEPDAKKQRVLVIHTSPDDNVFASPAKTQLPQIDEQSCKFLEPKGWLDTTCAQVLGQARIQDKDNTRCSPIALVRCSRGGKTRSMKELAKRIRVEDDEYAIVFISFNTGTPLAANPRSPIDEVCIRIAFAALKLEGELDYEDFDNFYSKNEVSKEWVKEWLGSEKCILLIDELNLLQDRIDRNVAVFLKEYFVLRKGRGLVFASHLATLQNKLADFMFSESNREVVLRPLPLIPSLRETRNHFQQQDLSPQEVLFLGLIPSLIVEVGAGNKITRRRSILVENYIEELKGGSQMASMKEVCMLLTSLVTGKNYTPLQELMTADLNQQGDTIVRWIPFHMTYVLSELSVFSPSADIDDWMRRCLRAISDLFHQFRTAKWESGDAWEALFIIVLIVRCVTREFDNVVVPLDNDFGGDTIVPVRYNQPYGSWGEFQTKDPAKFLEGIPVEAETGISIYYPTHSKFQGYDVILACWNSEGTRSLYGYQLKEGSNTPKSFVFDNMFDSSFLIRGQLASTTKSVRLWCSVSDAELDAFFGESAKQWSAKSWKRLQTG